MCHERCRTTVLKGERGHGVVHLQKTPRVVVKRNDWRHAFAHRDAALVVTVDRHKVAIAEDIPGVTVNAGRIPSGRREI